MDALRRLLLLALACLITSIRVQAAPVTYTVTTTATGTLGATPFTNASMTITLTGNTTGVGSPSAPSLQNPGTATVTIAGVGTATFTDSMAAASTYNTTFDGIYLVGIFDTTQGILISFVEGNSLAGYNLATPLSFSGSGGLGNGGGTSNIFPTTAGNLEFAGQQPPVVVAAAVTVVVTTLPATPAPPSVYLMLLGLAGVGFYLVRRTPKLG